MAKIINLQLVISAALNAIKVILVDKTIKDPVVAY